MDPLSLDAVSVVLPNCRALYEECVRGQTFGYLDLTEPILARATLRKAGSARAWTVTNSGTRIRARAHLSP
jgi:hypothetical protein